MKRKFRRINWGISSPVRRRLDYLAIVLLTLWIVGWTVNGFIGAERTGRGHVPAQLVSKIVEDHPGHKFYLVFDKGACGTPYRMTLNYLYNRVIDEDVIVVTSDQVVSKLRGLRKRGLSIAIGNDDLLAQTAEHVDAFLIERLDSGALFTYPFTQPTMSEYISVLDDVFGTSEQQFHGMNHR